MISLDRQTPTDRPEILQRSKIYLKTRSGLNNENNKNQNTKIQKIENHRFDIEQYYGKS